MTINRTPISVREAVGRVLDTPGRLPHETVPYTQSHARILAADLTATDDVPLFTKSAMDGFAIRSEDSAGASGDSRISFKVVEEIPAGASSDYVLAPNEAF